MQALIWQPLCFSSVQSEMEIFLKSDVRRFPMKSSDTLSRDPEGMPMRPSNYRQSAATVWITFFYQARKSSAKQIFTLCLIITALLSHSGEHLTCLYQECGEREERWPADDMHTHTHTHSIQMQTPTHRDTNTINLSTTSFDGDEEEMR